MNKIAYGKVYYDDHDIKWLRNSMGHVQLIKVRSKWKEYFLALNIYQQKLYVLRGDKTIVNDIQGNIDQVKNYYSRGDFVMPDKWSLDKAYRIYPQMRRELNGMPKVSTLSSLVFLVAGEESPDFVLHARQIIGFDTEKVNTKAVFIVNENLIPIEGSHKGYSYQELFLALSNYGLFDDLSKKTLAFSYILLEGSILVAGNVYGKFAFKFLGKGIRKISIHYLGEMVSKWLIRSFISAAKKAATDTTKLIARGYVSKYGEKRTLTKDELLGEITRVFVHALIHGILKAGIPYPENSSIYTKIRARISGDFEQYLLAGLSLHFVQVSTDIIIDSSTSGGSLSMALNKISSDYTKERMKDALKWLLRSPA